MSRARWRFVVPVLATALAFSCGKSDPNHGGLMVIIDEDGDFGLDRIDVLVTGSGDRTLHERSYRLPGEAKLPTTLAIVSNDDPAATAKIRISGWREEVALDVRDAIVTQVPVDRVAELRVVLSGRCSAQVEIVDGKAVSKCGGGTGDETCNPTTGECESSAVIASTLGTYQPGNERLPAGTGGTGSGGSGGTGSGAGGDALTGGEGGLPGADVETCPAPCSDMQTCVNAVCFEHECTPSARFCAGAALRECDADGLASQAVKACGSGTYCDPRSLDCEEGVCARDQPVCDDTRATVCNASGSGYRGGGMECDGGTVCSAGDCVPGVCEPSRRFCQGKNVKQCAVDGLSSQVESSCKSDEYCDDGGGMPACKPQVCTPNKALCSGNTVRACSADGSGYQDVDDCTKEEHCDAKSGTCKPGGCPTGFGDCTDEAGCETPLGTTTDCLGCGDTCRALNGGNECTEGGCKPSCDMGYADCDGDANGGCETDARSDPTNCGGCGMSGAQCGVLFPNAQSECSDSQCVFEGCDKTHLDCAAPEMDCETVQDTTHCGACDVSCKAGPGASTHSTGTQCDTTGSTGICAPTCEPGWGACANPEDGCTVSLKTAMDCGQCNKACSILHGSATCVTGTCTPGTCDAGYASCDSSPGCETELGTDSDCSGCGASCTNMHGMNRCVGSPGNYECSPMCSTGFDDCDGNRSNGCDADLSEPGHCGSCGNVCSTALPDCVLSGGEYKCQARVAYVNDVESSSSTATLDLTHSLSAGTNRLVIAAVVSEANNYTSLNGARPEVVTYGGLPMTAVPNGSQTSDGPTAGYDAPQLYYYYLTDTGATTLPTSGAQSVHIDSTAGNDDPFMTAVNVISFTGVDQTTPILVGTGLRVASPGATCMVASPMTTVIPGTALYALTAGQYVGIASSPAQGGLTTVLNINNLGHQIHVYGGYSGSYPTVLAAASYTIGFRYNYCNPAAVLPLGIQPARQP